MAQTFHPCLPVVAASFIRILFAGAVLLLPGCLWAQSQTEAIAPASLTESESVAWKPEWAISGGLVAGGPSFGVGGSLRLPMRRVDLRLSLLPGIARGYAVVDTYIEVGMFRGNGFVWGVGPAAESIIDRRLYQRLGGGFTFGWRRAKWMIEARTNLYLLHIGPTIGLWASYSLSTRD